MRQVLNNPWVVFALCVVAVGILYLNAGEVSVNPAPISKAIPLPSTQSPKVQKLEMTDSPIALVSLAWPESFARDPFAPAAPPRSKGQSEFGESANQESDSGTLTDRIVGPLPSLQLSAITLEPRPKRAVINRTIVEEGELIEGLRVSRIEPDGVWVKGPLGPHRVGFGMNQGKSQRVRSSEKTLNNSHEATRDFRKSRRNTKLIDGRDCLMNPPCS